MLDDHHGMKHLNPNLGDIICIARGEGSSGGVKRIHITWDGVDLYIRANYYHTQ